MARFLAIHSEKMMRLGCGLLLLLLFHFPSAVAQEADLLCRACREAFSGSPISVFPRAERKCAQEPEERKTWCVARNLATFYRTQEQIGEFAVLYDNLLNYCPTRQAREYFKERLYYLATQLDKDDIPSSFRTFDFGPVVLSTLGRLAAHTDRDNRGRMYDRAIAKHHPPRHPYLDTILGYCNDAQPGAPEERPRTGGG